MTEPPAPPSSRRLPRRDWVVLPLLALATVLVMVGAVESGARILMPEAAQDPCIGTDPVIGHRARPFCVSKTKSPESPWVENRYNDCGYRSVTSCKPPPAGTVRIAVIGSSTSWGYHVPYGQTWFARTGVALTAACNRPVDVQNLGGLFSLSQIAVRADEAAALKPDVAVMLIAPFDLEQLETGPFKPATATGSDGTAKDKPSGLKALQNAILDSRAVIGAQHLIFAQPASYVPLYLRYKDKADFLRPPFTPAWRQRLAYLDDAVGYISARFKARGTPFVLGYVPQQAQADIVAGKLKIAGVDPFAIDRAIEAIAARHGVIFRDLTPAFETVPSAPALYLNVDGHLNDAGNALLAKMMAASLSGSSQIPAFGTCAALDNAAAS